MLSANYGANSNAGSKLQTQKSSAVTSDRVLNTGLQFGGDKIALYAALAVLGILVITKFSGPSQGGQGQMSALDNANPYNVSLGAKMSSGATSSLKERLAFKRLGKSELNTGISGIDINLLAVMAAIVLVVMYDRR